MDRASQTTLWVRLQNHLQNKRVLVAIAAAGALLIYAASVTDAARKLAELINPPQTAAKAEYCELLVPLMMQFDRTKAAFDRWNDKNLSLESEIIFAGNKEARQILMNKGHLIAAKLENDARRLVEHYDRWFEEFDRIRVRAKQNNEPFVFVGPAGFPFPTAAERRFRERAAELRQVLGSENPCR